MIHSSVLANTLLAIVVLYMISDTVAENVISRLESRRLKRRTFYFSQAMNSGKCTYDEENKLWILKETPKAYLMNNGKIIRLDSDVATLVSKMTTPENKKMTSEFIPIF